ncbi:unnamed protein product [Phytophthora lilii]|uniref:Unnamed protein product n=1 Tax=Phytophthora lilii TaxID=2077276 RepID=A0A9W6YEI0_9STRA|nr:unnamed protein product [Phytophthora lilii]
MWQLCVRIRVDTSVIEAYYRRQLYGNPGVARSSARAPDPTTPRYPDLDPGRSAFGSTTLAKDLSMEARWQHSARPVGPRSCITDAVQAPVTRAPDPGWSLADRAMIWTDLVSRTAAMVSSSRKDVRSMMCGRVVVGMIGFGMG